MMENCLGSFLAAVFDGASSLSFDERKIEQVYEAMEEFFYGDKLTIRFIAPLLNFEMAGDKLRLENRFALIRLSVSEREQLVASTLEFPALLSPFRSRWTGFEEFGLELFIDTVKVIGHQSTLPPASEIPQQRGPQVLQEGILALRLFKAGGVGHSGFRQTLMGWNPIPGGASIGLITSVATIGTNYTLSCEEAAGFARFWREYLVVRSRKRPRIEVALNRVNFAYDRIRPEDQLIDYVIGLEALLTNKGEQGDLAYRLALRGARLLGDDAHTRIHISTMLNQAYRLRSKIVHGADIGNKVLTDQETMLLPEFVNKIADYLRRAIKIFMERTATGSEERVIEALDHALASGN